MQALAELIGTSPGIVALREQVRRLLQRQGDARRLPPVLIQGETGTGKGLLARVLHRAGPRPDGPFVDVNCAAIPETLLEAELFGFERGAFTDARHAKAGLFQTANRGTLFLDEVGLLPEALQAKLLKAIEERAVRRLGSTRTESVDVWILAATNEDLAAAARERRFREDLYHRLAVLTMRLPPLRDRQQDIPALTEHFLARACAEYDLPPRTFAPEARAALVAYRWPGNVRELANAMERVALLSEESLVTVEMLGLPEAPPPAPPAPARSAGPAALEDALGSVERDHLTQALEDTRWNITRAATRLGISRDTLRYRITKHGLRPTGPPRAPRRPARSATPPPAVPAPAAPLETAAPATVRWERRRLTLLRVVLTVPAADDPRLYPSRAIEVLVEKVQSFGGRVEELSPSGVVAAFGLEPVEDAPRRAAHAAMAIHKAAEHAWRGEAERLAVSCAVHVAPFLVGQSSGGAQLDLEGKRRAWGVLEALVTATGPDGIAVSEAAAPFLERHLALAPLAVSGDTPGRAYRLQPGAPTGLTPGRRMATFVGRRQELEFLRSRWEATKRGHGQVVGILGEAGIGKSRLLFEFRQSLRGERVTYLEGACPSYGGAMPYLPVLDILRQNLRIRDADGPEGITEKVRAGLRRVGTDPGEWGPYLLELLGVREGTESLATLAPGAIKARTFEMLRQMGLKGCRQRPIVFVVEDLHWIDRTSEECFSSLMESLAGAPALFLTTYRPGYRPPWVDKSYMTQVALQPLSAQDSLTVVRSVLRLDDIPESLVRVILEKSEGNPFFLEELSRAVGQTSEARSPGAIPDTIQEVLLARVARLAEVPRRLLQTASVIGREVPAPLLRALWGDAGDPEPHLRELVRLEFLYDQSGGIEPVYAFTHALTQEVAYESLPLSRRQTLHALAGQALEAIYAERLEEVYDRLVHHYAKSEHAGRAVEYLTRSADRAARAHAHIEAVRILQEALAHVERLPAADRDRRVLDLVLRQAYSFVPQGGFQAIVDLLGRHQATLDRLQDPWLAGHYYFLLGRSQLFLGDDASAADSARRGIEEATRCGDDATLGKIDYFLAQQSALSGRMLQGIEHARQAVTLLERTGEQWWIGPAYWALGLNHALMGEFEPAREALGRAAAIGEAIGDLELQSAVGWPVGAIHAAMGEADAGFEACRRSLRLAPDPLNTAISLGWLGYVHLERGDAEEARTLLGQAVEQVGRFRFVHMTGLFTAFLADAHRATGQLDRARDLAGQALELTRTRSLYGVGWAERALGRIDHARHDITAAETWLAAALETFGRIHARYDLARTHLDMAVLAHSQGRRDALARHLREADGLFRLLRIPAYVARTGDLAKEFDVLLGELPDRRRSGPGAGGP
jgi:DNA-binding NtrC family response regulator/tetratricopeptide (TPR) repeat protein